MEDKKEKVSSKPKRMDPIDDSVTIRIREPDLVLSTAVWSGKHMKNYINLGDIPDDRVTPNGVDLSIDKLFRQRGNVILTVNKHETDKGVLWEMTTRNNIAGLSGKEGWMVSPGYYTVQWAEHIGIPTDAIGLLLPRSTLLRTCATIYGAVWDRGYRGVGQSGFHVFDYLMLERGTPLAQMIFIKATDWGNLYDGQYQGENIDTKDDDI